MLGSGRKKKKKKISAGWKIGVDLHHLHYFYQERRSCAQHNKLATVAARFLSACVWKYRKWSEISRMTICQCLHYTAIFDLRWQIVGNICQLLVSIWMYFVCVCGSFCSQKSKTDSSGEFCVLFCNSEKIKGPHYVGTKLSPSVQRLVGWELAFIRLGSHKSES